MFSIEQLMPGDRVRLCGFRKGEESYRQKLLSMGLTPGTEFVFVRQAPLGDPIQIEVRNFCLTLRKAEATLMKIEKVNED